MLESVSKLTAEGFKSSSDGTPRWHSADFRGFGRPERIEQTGVFRVSKRPLKSHGGSVQFLFDKDAESIVLESVFEAPIALSGITADLRDKLLETVINRQCGPQVVAIQDQSEALELLDVAIRAATTELRDATQLTGQAFEVWLADASPIDSAEAAAEAAKVAETSVEAAALALPASARHTLVSSLLAANSDELVGKPKAA